MTHIIHCAKCISTGFLPYRIIWKESNTGFNPPLPHTQTKTHLHNYLSSMHSLFKFIICGKSEKQNPFIINVQSLSA